MLAAARPGIRGNARNVVTFSDNFNRADAPTLGANWLQAARTSNGVIGVSGNQAYMSSGTSDFDAVIAYPAVLATAGRSDLDMTFTAATVASTSSRLAAFRMGDPTGGANMRYWSVLADRITYFRPGLGGGTAYFFSTPVVSGDVVRIVCAGSSINCYRNGSLDINATDTQGQTDTLHGLSLITVGTHLSVRLDDFSIAAS